MCFDADFVMDFCFCNSLHFNTNITTVDQYNSYTMHIKLTYSSEAIKYYKKHCQSTTISHFAENSVSAVSVSEVLLEIETIDLLRRLAKPSCVCVCIKMLQFD